MLSLGDEDEDSDAGQQFSGQDVNLDSQALLPLDDDKEQEEAVVHVPLDTTKLVVRKRTYPDQKTAAVAEPETQPVNTAQKPSAPAAKKRRTTAGAGEKKKASASSTSNSISAMVSCLSGAAKPAELADLGDEGLLLAQAPVVKPRPEASATTGEHAWLRESAAFSSFVPTCTDDAFVHESAKVGHTSLVMKEFVEILTKELATALNEAKQMPRQKQQDSAEGSLIKRIRAMEAMLSTLDKRMNMVTNKLTQLGTALREHTDRHLELMRRHREYVRNLICHFTRSYTFDPDTPGSHLISDPFIMT